MELKSNSVAKVLKIFLWISVISNVIVLGNVIVASIIEVGSSFARFDQFISILLAGVTLISTIIYLIWLYKIHKDLKNMDSQYPITPGGALRRVMIPFYNIYGLWNVYSTMSKEFKKDQSTFRIGKYLGIYVPIYYSLIFITSWFNSYIAGIPVMEVPTIIWFSSYLGDLVLTIIYILMLKIIINALVILSDKEYITVINSDDEEMHEN